MAQLIVVYGPSGTGKSTLINKLIKSENKFCLNVSHTTRSPRMGEENGLSYHFIDDTKFEEMKSCGEFMETFEYVGKKYGTSFKSIENCLANKKIPILDVNVKTVEEIRGFEFIMEKHPIYLMVKPPSFEELRKRLTNRGDSKDHIRERMKHAEKEIQQGNNYADKIIVNTDFETSYEEFKDYILNKCNI